MLVAATLLLLSRTPELPPIAIEHRTGLLQESIEAFSSTLQAVAQAVEVHDLITTRAGTMEEWGVIEDAAVLLQHQIDSNRALEPCLEGWLGLVADKATRAQEGQDSAGWTIFANASKNAKLGWDLTGRVTRHPAVRFLGGLGGAGLGFVYDTWARDDAVEVDRSVENVVSRGLDGDCLIRALKNACPTRSMTDRPLRPVGLLMVRQGLNSMRLTFEPGLFSLSDGGGVAVCHIFSGERWRQSLGIIEARSSTPSGSISLPGVSWSNSSLQASGWSVLASLDIVLPGIGHHHDFVLLDQREASGALATEVAAEIHSFSSASTLAAPEEWLKHWLRAETAGPLLQKSGLDVSAPLQVARSAVGRVMGRTEEPLKLLAWFDAERRACRLPLENLNCAMQAGLTLIREEYRRLQAWRAGDGSVARLHDHALSVERLEGHSHPWRGAWGEAISPWLVALRSEAEALPADGERVLVWLESFAADIPTRRSPLLRAHLKQALDPAFVTLEELADNGQGLDSSKVWRRLVKLERSIRRVADSLQPSFIRVRLHELAGEAALSLNGYVESEIHGTFEGLSGETSKAARSKAERRTDRLDARLGSDDPRSAWVAILNGERIRERGDATVSALRRLEAFDQALKCLLESRSAIDGTELTHPLGAGEMKAAGFALFGASRVAYAASSVARELERGGRLHAVSSRQYANLGDSLLMELEQKFPLMMTLAGNRAVSALRSMR